MNHCDGALRDQLPEIASGRATEPNRARGLAHAEVCADCAAELELLTRLYEDRPPLPDVLATRIAAGVRAGTPFRARRRRWVPAWGLAAAAVAGLAFGIPSLIERMSPTVAGDDLEAVAMLGSPWLSGDPLIAGAPVLESLSDDELTRLLEELER